MKKYILKYALILLVACLGMQQAGAKVWYVNSSAVTWQGKAEADVKTSIADAISAAAAGDQVWVASGTFNLSATITLKNGVSLYGGFDGKENNIDDRERVVNGKSWEFLNSTVLDGQGKYAVMTGAKFTTAVVIDGFTLQNGKANKGGGMVSQDNTVVQHCIFLKNSATDAGGGLNLEGAGSLAFECYFTGNSAKHGGGAAIGTNGTMRKCLVAANKTIATASSYWADGWGGGVMCNNSIIESCELYNNTASYGGGIYMREKTSAAYNCIIAHNTGHQGGAAAWDNRNGGGKLVNCVIAFNTSGNNIGGGVMFTKDGQNVTNCIFWENKLKSGAVNHFVSYDSGSKKEAEYKYVIQHCAFQGSPDDVDQLKGENHIALSLDSTSYFGPLWVPNEDFPGIDKGTLIDGLPTTDFAGNVRISGRGIDIGVYESVIVPKPDGDVFYVDKDATGRMNGSSWVNAFLDIQTAINAAKLYNDENGVQTQIWVAAGTYELTATISLQSGVSIYGGFDKTEKGIGDRKVNSLDPWDYANPTILKGNKTCQIINSIEPANDKALTEATYVNGFTLTGGYANGSGDYYTCGGAAHLKQNMFVQNCVITGNEAKNQGGGVSLRGDANLCGLENCLIEHNVATGAGGGVSLFGNSSKNYVRNCVIRNNESKATGVSAGGGGLYNFLGTAENCIIKENKAVRGGGVTFRRYLSTSVVNCLIEGNTATTDGGAISLSDHNSQAAVNIFNCTVVGNQAPSGKNTLSWAENKYKFDNVKIVNSIFYGNKAGEIVTLGLPEGLNATYSAFEKAYNGTGNIVIPEDGSFWGENWHLAENSPAKNAGTTENITVLDFDLDGADRVQDGHIDMGAYEIGVIYIPDINGVFYVRADGNNGNNGSSWENALKDISFALARAEAYNKKLVVGQTRARLWIAGEYELTESIALVDGVSMYGGFAGTETSLEERAKGAGAWDFSSPTVLKDKAGKQITLISQAAAFANETTVDGFTLSNGKQGAILKGNVTFSCNVVKDNVSGNVTDGAGINASGDLCVVEHCLVEGNVGKNGGGVTISSGAVIRNSKIADNTSVYTGSMNQGWGGGVFNNAATVENCVITGNKAPHGGGVFVRHASAEFYNCLVAGNSSTKTGGGVAFDSFGDHLAAVKDAKIYNFTIVDNTTEGEGAGVYFSNEGQTLVNTVLYGNTRSGAADEYSARDGVTPLLTTCAVRTTESLSDGNIAFTDPATVFTDAAQGDWTLCARSICEDKGTSVDGIPASALGGNLREQGRRIDIGAYERDSDFEYGPSAEGIVYVALGQEGQGKAWDDAVGDINQAIAIAKEYNDGIDEDGKKAQVWVKTGEYRLSEPVKVVSGVSIYGGFAGTERTLTERAKGSNGWEYVNPTLLRGAAQTFAVIFQEKDFSEETTIDGFTVEDGMPGVILLKNTLLKCCIVRNNKSRTSNLTLPGGAIINNNAGGVFIKYASVVDSCLIENNSSTSSGGGIYAENSAGIVIKNSTVQHNVSGTMGGGIFSWQATVQNCIVRGNTANTNGGGIVVRQTASVYYNCIVEGNTAKGKGGGIWFKDDNNQAVNAVVYNMTVVNNTAGGNGGGVYFGWAGQTLVNTVLWGNVCKGKEQQYEAKSGVTPTFTNCAAPVALTGSNVVLTQDSSEIFAENWTLCEGSPCIDKGTDVAGLPDTDVYGNRRWSGEAYDIGACEYLIPLQYEADENGVFYVKKVKEMGRGNSWDSPINDLNTAVQAAKAWSAEYKKTAQIWVAKGTYALASTLDISTKVALYGGFAGDESLLTERQLKTGGKSWEFGNEVILDAGSKFRAVAISADGVVFDGFTVMNGKTTGTGDDHALCGAGIYTMNGGVVISNCIVKKNYCESVGAGIGIRTNTGDVLIENCLVTANTGKNNGGGIGLYGNSATLTVRGCEVTDNQGTNGGGVYVFKGKIENSVISGNTGTTAAVYLRSYASSTIYNSLVAENTVTGEGGAIYCQTANNAGVYNCTVVKNNGGGLYYKVSPTDLPVVNTIFWGNEKDGEIREFSADNGQSAENAKMTYTAYDGTETHNGAGNLHLTQEESAIFAEGWTLTILSPCVDKGTEITGIPEKDLAGNARKSNGMIDMGAYEFQAALDEFRIDFRNETIAFKADASKRVECSVSRSPWTSEEFSSLIGREKRVIYCRAEGGTEVYEIALPGRYFPSAEIDFSLEKLVKVAENTIWEIQEVQETVADSASLTSYIDEGVPGFTLTQAATEKAFRTDSLYRLPARKTAPGFTVSFAGERLTRGDGNVDMTLYEAGKDLKEWQALTADASISSLIPATETEFTLYVREKATATDFASRNQSWKLKGRPAAPLYSVHFADSTTQEVVTSTVEYDTLNTFASVRKGEDERLKLQPGHTYYFRIAASEEEQVFVSVVDSLIVPAVTDIRQIRINFSEEKLEGLNEYVCWKVDGGTEAQAREDISAIISKEGDVRLTLYVPGGVAAFATEAYTLTLPRREAAPQWSISYTDEVIIDAVEQLTPDNWEVKLPGASEYSRFDESGLLTSLIPVAREEDKVLSLRTAAAVDAFHSEACEVILPARPETPVITVDFSNERTREVIPSYVEYSVLDDMEAAQLGGDTTLLLEPGVDLYLRVKATAEKFASSIQKVTVPDRPAITEVSIDFENQRLLDLPAATVWQVNDGEVTQAREQLGEIIPAAGQADATLKIWVPEQENSFKSEVIALKLPAYPADPRLQIDYDKEELVGIADHMMWNYKDTTYRAATDLSSLIPAYGEEDLSISVWVAASDTSFRSVGETRIVLPARKANTGLYTIDFISETTQEVITDEIAYRYDAPDENWNTGSQEAIGLRPGVNILLKRKADPANRLFASATTLLEVPHRPVITAEEQLEIRLSDGEYIPEIRNSWTNTIEGIQISIGDPEIAALNGYRIVPKKQGECSLILAMAAVEDEHFAAETKTVNLRVISDGGTGEELSISNLKIAGRSDMVFRIPELDGVSGVGLVVYNQRGKVVFEAKEYGRDFDMGHLDAGTYYYVLTYPKDGKKQTKKGFVEIVR